MHKPLIKTNTTFLYYNEVMEHRTLLSGICYTVQRKKMKNMRIRVTGDLRVSVSAPYRLAESRIQAFVEQNEPYIKERLIAIEKQRQHGYPLNYESGDTFLYLGQRKSLRVMKESRAYAGLDNKELVLCVPPGASAKQLFSRWMMRNAKQVFAERLQALLPRFNINVDGLPISVRNMLTRWGSINPKRLTLSLSVHLMRCETELIDYVIMHELCHIACPSHNAAFYKELEAHCPNRKEMDKRLAVYGLVDF